MKGNLCFNTSVKVVMITRCSLTQLSVEIGIVFSELRYFYFLGFEQDRVKDIQKAVLAGTYVLSPLRLQVFPKDHPQKESFHILSVPEFPDVFFAVRPEKGDGLVLMALARMLTFTFLSYSFFISNSFGFRRDKDVCDFYTFLVGWSKVETLFDFDLTTSFNKISRSRLKAKLKPLIKDRSIFRLVSSSIELPILDESGRDWSALVGAGVTPASLLATVLLNFYLDELDRAFIDRFPSFSYARYIHAVFLALPLKNKKVFLKEVETLLKELGLAGEIICIGRGSAPVPCYGGFVVVNEEGVVSFIEKDSG